MSRQRGSHIVRACRRPGGGGDQRPGQTGSAGLCGGLPWERFHVPPEKRHTLESHKEMPQEQWRDTLQCKGNRVKKESVRLVQYLGPFPWRWTVNKTKS